MVLATTLIGTEDMVRARLRAWRDAGVDTVRLYPAGDTPTARLDTLARGIDLVRSLWIRRAMLYMVIEKYRPGPGPVYQRAAERGRMLGRGRDSWVVDAARR